MSNTQYKPSEGKREEFRKYLEKNGVMDALTKVLVSLYEEAEKPVDALSYIRDRLAIQSGLETLSDMKQKQEELQKQVTELEEKIQSMKVAPTEDEAADGGEETAPPQTEEAAAAPEADPTDPAVTDEN